MFRIACLAALSVACATSQRPSALAKPALAKNDAQQAPAKAKPVQHCRLERDTGSNIAQRVCDGEGVEGTPADQGTDQVLMELQRRQAIQASAGH